MAEVTIHTQYSTEQIVKVVLEYLRTGTLFSWKGKNAATFTMIKGDDPNGHCVLIVPYSEDGNHFSFIVRSEKFPGTDYSNFDEGKAGLELSKIADAIFGRLKSLS